MTVFSSILLQTIEYSKKFTNSYLPNLVPNPPSADSHPHPPLPNLPEFGFFFRSNQSEKWWAMEKLKRLTIMTSRRRTGSGAASIGPWSPTIVIAPSLKCPRWIPPPLLPHLLRSPIGILCKYALGGVNCVFF